MNRRGVTLIELVTVMAIIAILALLTVPSISTWMAHYRLRTGARDIVSVMRTAQMRAVSYNMRYGVAFDAGNKQFQLYRDSGGLQVEGPANLLPTGVTYKDNTIALPVEGAVGLPFVSFFPNSSASAAGTIILKNSKGREKTIQVFTATGRITVQ